jgi:hypothetical protein
LPPVATGCDRFAPLMLHPPLAAPSPHSGMDGRGREPEPQRPPLGTEQVRKQARSESRLVEEIKHLELLLVRGCTTVALAEALCLLDLGAP